MANYRVLMIHPGGNWGGGSIAFLKVAEALRQSGTFSPLLVFGAEGMAPAQSREMRYPVYVQPVAYTPLGGILETERGRLLNLPRFLFHFLPSHVGLARLIRANSVDLAYINTSTPVGAAISLRTLGLPIIWHVREVVNRKNTGGRIAAYCIHHLADVIVANSDCSASIFRQSGKTVRAYDGVPLRDQFRERELEALRACWSFGPATPLVGVISPVAHHKGQHVLLAAVPEILKQVPDARFMVVGGSTIPEGYWNTFRGKVRRMFGQRDYASEIRRHVHDAGLAEFVHFDGWRTDITLVTSALDVVVFPSIIREGFGRPQVEAGAAGKPVVASDIGPARELVEDGVTGILFPPGDSGALASAVVALLQDRERAQAMGQAGRERVEKYFSDAIHAQAIVKVFEDTVGALSKGRGGQR